MRRAQKVTSSFKVGWCRVFFKSKTEPSSSCSSSKRDWRGWVRNSQMRTAQWCQFFFKQHSSLKFQNISSRRPSKTIYDVSKSTILTPSPSLCCLFTSWNQGHLMVKWCVYLCTVWSIIMKLPQQVFSKIDQIKGISITSTSNKAPNIDFIFLPKTL